MKKCFRFFLTLAIFVLFHAIPANATSLFMDFGGRIITPVKICAHPLGLWFMIENYRGITPGFVGPPAPLPLIWKLLTTKQVLWVPPFIVDQHIMGKAYRTKITCTTFGEDQFPGFPIASDGTSLLPY